MADNTDATDVVACPSIDNLDCRKDGEWNLFLGPTPTYLSIVSSSFSIFGALSIILTYLLFAELRTTTRSIITFLAVADFATAFGYLLGGINYLIYYNNYGQGCLVYQVICSIQSYITIWSQLCSYSWNCFLAVFLYIMIVYVKHRIADRMVTLFHVFAWTLPLCVALPLLATNQLDYSPYLSSNWCFIKDEGYRRGRTMLRKEMVITLLVGKIPELFTFAFLIFFYTLTRCFMRQRIRYDTDSILKHSIKRIHQRLLVIPLFFVLLKMWGPIQFFFSVTISHHWDGGCIKAPFHYTHLVLAMLEAIGDGGQGWANALIFVYFNSRTRALILEKCKMIIIGCCRYCNGTRGRHRAILKGLDSSYGSLTVSGRNTSLNRVGSDTIHYDTD